MARFKLPDEYDESKGGPRPVDGTYLFKVIAKGPLPTEAGGNPQLDWPVEVAHTFPGYESQLGRKTRHYTWLHAKAFFKTQQMLDALNIPYKPGQTLDGEKFVGMKFGGILQTERPKGMDKDRQEIKTVLSGADYKLLYLKEKAAYDAHNGAGSLNDMSDDVDDYEEDTVPTPPAPKAKRRPEPEPEEDIDYEGEDLDDDEEDVPPPPPKKRRPVATIDADDL